MGGGRRYDYPKYVWSPAGGWWSNPVHWKRNSAFFLLGSSLILAVVYNWGEKHTTIYKSKAPTIHEKPYGQEHH